MERNPQVVRLAHLTALVLLTPPGLISGESYALEFRGPYDL